MKFLGAMLVLVATVMPAQTSDVAIDNFKFTAPTITVPVGTTVTWTNRDDVPHNVVSTDKRSSRRCSTPIRSSRTRSRHPARSSTTARCIHG